MEGILCFPTPGTGKILVPPPPNRMKIPKDGMGPRGAPDCYYTSRVLNSTFRYVRFVRRLRALEEEIRKGDENQKQALLDRQRCDFFIRCDRKSLLKRVESRVKLCMESYERDLEEKRNQLRKMLEEEERENIRKFVVQAQAGNESVWQDKMERLDYLLKKRAKEHAERYKDTPLSKAPHIIEDIRKIQAMEIQDIQLYQMKEKRARKEAEKELDMMWHAVAMREADALAARMEIDAIAMKRRDTECKEHSDQQMELNRIKREQERERLKQETLWLKSIWESENIKEEEKERMRQQQLQEIKAERLATLELTRELNKKRQEEEKQIQETWDALTGKGLADQKAQLELRRRTRRETDLCNDRLTKRKECYEESLRKAEPMFAAERQKAQDVMDLRRCKFKKWQERTNREVRAYMVEQIKDKEKRTKEEKIKEDEYIKSLGKQDKWGLEIDSRGWKEKAAIAQNHQDLLEQIAYNKLLKERAIQEEQDQLRKFAQAKQDYEAEYNRMLQRPFYSDGINPFMKEMAVKKLEMKKKCPCSKPDYCK